MSASRKLICVASTFVILGLTQTGFAAGHQTSVGGWLLAMDDGMKPKQQVTGIDSPVETNQASSQAKHPISGALMRI